MSEKKLMQQFCQAVEKVGGQVLQVKNIDRAVEYISEHTRGTVVVPPFSSGEKLHLAERLEKQGLKVASKDLRRQATSAEAGVTGVNFAIADTGTLVLDSTDEDIRLATTLPEKHFALLDPAKIILDGLAAVVPLRSLHQRDPRNYIAYITGPSRTADIERVLTIGVHGPRELHILLLEGLSEDLLEM